MAAANASTAHGVRSDVGSAAAVTAEVWEALPAGVASTTPLKPVATGTKRSLIFPDGCIMMT